MVVQRTKAMYGSGRIYTPCRNLTENRNILIQGENMNMKKLVSALLAALMLVGIGLCAIPKNAFALPRKDVTVPEGYPEYEYLVLVEILKTVTNSIPITIPKIPTHGSACRKTAAGFRK